MKHDFPKGLADLLDDFLILKLCPLEESASHHNFLSYLKMVYHEFRSNLCLSEREGVRSILLEGHASADERDHPK